MSSCSSKFEREESDEGEKENHFNVFANSFHVTDKVRVSMSLPKLTEDMLKINQELHDISTPAMEGLNQMQGNQTPAQTFEAKGMSSAKTLAETVETTPFPAEEKVLRI